MLLLLVLPSKGSSKINRRPIGTPTRMAADSGEEWSSPCKELQITSAGVICETIFGFEASLDFPEVDLRAALAGNEYLPQTEHLFEVDETNYNGKSYRLINLELRWEPNTPDFLQIYLAEYVPYWGNRVPYRLLWKARYEVCSVEFCTIWVEVKEKGEFLPSDIQNLESGLDADVNFNGVPAAFWNSHILP